MLQLIFDLSGCFWCGNLYMYFNLLDGVLDSGEVCWRYKVEGYDFLVLMDYFVGEYDYLIVDIKLF